MMRNKLNTSNRRWFKKGFGLAPQIFSLLGDFIPALRIYQNRLSRTTPPETELERAIRLMNEAQDKKDKEALRKSQGKGRMAPCSTWAAAPEKPFLRVPPSPWPFGGACAIFAFSLGSVAALHSHPVGWVLCVFALFALVVVGLNWSKDAFKDSRHLEKEGLRTSTANTFQGQVLAALAAGVFVLTVAAGYFF